MEQEKILRINELAKKKKEVGLTDEETRERSALYAQYIKEFREQTEGVTMNPVILVPSAYRPCTAW